MKRWFSILFLLISVSITQAQTDTPSAMWEIVENCVGEPTTPPADWTLEGFIAYYDERGIHAIRNEIDTPYFLAFANNSQFVQYARFSPDGRWLAVPSGYRTRANWTDYHYSIDEIRVFSTGLDRQLVHRIPHEYVILFSSGYFYPDNIHEWESNESFVYNSGTPYGEQELKRFFVTDDGYEVVEIDDIDEVPDDRLVPLSLPEDFTIIHQILPNGDGRHFAFAATRHSESQDVDYRIYVADTQTQQIQDLCVSWNQTSDIFFRLIDWAPNGRQLLLDSYFRISPPDIETLQIIDLDDNQHYQVPYYFSGYVMAWYP